jgi:hypothetical protein
MVSYAEREEEEGREGGSGGKEGERRGITLRTTYHHTLVAWLETPPQYWLREAGFQVCLRSLPLGFPVLGVHGAAMLP